MRNRLLPLFALISIVLIACGTARERPAASALPTAKVPPAGASHAIAILLRTGASPQPVVDEIAGTGAYSTRAASSSIMPLNPRPLAPILRTYYVPVRQLDEEAGLQRAQSNPAVEQAWLIPWPPDEPKGVPRAQH